MDQPNVMIRVPLASLLTLNTLKRAEAAQICCCNIRQICHRQIFRKSCATFGLPAGGGCSLGARFLVAWPPGEGRQGAFCPSDGYVNAGGCRAPHSGNYKIC